MPVADPPRTALERLELLCDEGSLRAIRSAVSSRRMGARARAGDGVIGAAGTIGGRPVCCYAQDAGFAGGSVGAAHADTIVRVLTHAGRAGVPVVGFVESGGARMQEGLGALAGYARIFRANVALSGRVPQISVITGLSAGGGSYSPALTDFVVMTKRASMFLTGPAVVREVMGEETTAELLGGPKVHARNGVSHFTAADDVESVFLVRDVLGYLPDRAGGPLPEATPLAPELDDPSAVLPGTARAAYDVRAAAGGIVDAGSLLEVAPRWARNVVTALARVEGRPVGVIANQPAHLGGVLDADAAQKAARFVRTCDGYGLPLLVLVDTPGFMPGGQQEAAGVIRHGASLLHAFAAATVPRVTVVLRKAYGGAYITMNSLDLGADLALAWPQAELGIMGARQAVGIVHRRELAAAEEPEALRDALAGAYAAEHLTAGAAAADGVVDEVIAPVDTRARVAAVLHAHRAPVAF
jgi:acetyl-CoA carboxylase carboxyltransferase component